MKSAQTDHVINYEQLRHYNKVRSNGDSTDDVTRVIQSLLLKNTVKCQQRPKTAAGCREPIPNTPRPTTSHMLYENRKRHDIRLYLSGIHAGYDLTADDVDVDSLPVSRRDRVSQLDEMLHEKTLFKRSEAERVEIAEIVKELWPRELGKFATMDIVEELSLTVVTEEYPHRGMTIQGSGGLFMVLSGSVRTRSHQHLHVGGDLSAGGNEVGQLGGANLGPGDWFGTLVPVTSNNNLFTCVVTSQECRVLRIYPNDYKHVLARLKKRKVNEKLSTVRSCPNYRKWPPHVLNLIANHMQLRHFRDGDVILRQGKVPDKMVVLRSGVVDVIRMFPVYVGKSRFRAVLIGQLVEGDTFGESALMKGEKMSVELIARGRCQIGVVSSHDVKEFNLTTRTLLSQVTAKYDHVTRNDVKELLIRQQKAEDWRKTKHFVSAAWAHDYAVVNGEGKRKDAKL